MQWRRPVYRYEYRKSQNTCWRSGRDLACSAGNGEAGINGGPSGDLYIIVIVKEHELFERH